MKRSRLSVLGLLVFAGLLAAGCTAPQAQAALQATATPIPDEGQPAATEVSPAQPTATLLPTPTRIPDTSCIDCHSDADLLQELAEEEDVPEAPSEGSG